ncbi:sigma-70 family RNA polymerase sigma factor [Lentisphaera profundi]|uniref:Sigma-70 family RNA polymerase sigma factor n=1 Tax=Lentisphaera profundi TaxID=1658616 RepID=A0ABY7VXP9_9BACT|nr:sigma-70 family RNA polymerase sigma factor [Lentisphaera profundi]WDE97479.1 sigma-70 family RNA polymerase sigma factor [Lentisphaera profundi]
MNENTRLTLLEKVRNQHDEKSWGDFVDTYRPFIYSVCRKMNVAHYEAEELTQDILLKLWGKLPEFQYEKNGRFRAWLCTVTGNQVKNFFRSHQRRNERDKKYFDESITDPEIESITEESWKKYAVLRALENIRPLFSEKVFDIFNLLQQGKTRPQVAELMDVSPNQVSVYKERVLRRLTSEIRRLDQEWG